jgi:hypothetical protein
MKFKTFFRVTAKNTDLEECDFSTEIEARNYFSSLCTSQKGNIFMVEASGGDKTYFEKLTKI